MLLLLLLTDKCQRIFPSLLIQRSHH